MRNYKIRSASHYAFENMDGLVQEIMTIEGISPAYSNLEE